MQRRRHASSSIILIAAATYSSTDLGGELGGKADAGEDCGIRVRVGLRAIETYTGQAELERVHDAIHAAIGKRAKEKIALREPLHVAFERRFREHGGARHAAVDDARQFEIGETGGGKRKKLKLDVRLGACADAGDRIEQHRIELHGGSGDRHADRAVGRLPADVCRGARRERHGRLGQRQNLFREALAAPTKSSGRMK